MASESVSQPVESVSQPDDSHYRLGPLLAAQMHWEEHPSWGSVCVASNEVGASPLVPSAARFRQSAGASANHKAWGRAIKLADAHKLHVLCSSACPFEDAYYQQAAAGNRDDLDLVFDTAVFAARCAWRADTLRTLGIPLIANPPCPDHVAARTWLL
eukprot:CAMPEP_0172669834 /NCGR_PEP_ID=MMETSP1074-20121228/9929_1 /TAXON_ID=2916 /ORGANISM="Ceratium fusus, Strain PA161109" /LENGTH=156 /DNA_ID=CAMNT_0013486665 /DNA_START=108 /DNA_END=579 /DNA_ORIENTATION=+